MEASKTINSLTADLGLAPQSVMYASSQSAEYCLAHWRYFIGEYTVRRIASPLIIVHLGGKPNVRYKTGTDWSKDHSVPGDVTVAPNTVSASWQINGEVEILTFCLAGASETDAQKKPDKFAYSNSSLFKSGIRIGVDAPFIREMLMQLWRSFQNAPASDAADYRTHLLDFLETHLAQIDRTPAIQATPLPEARSGNFAQLQEVIHFISNHFTEDLKVKDLAKIADMKPTYFAQVFRAQMGVSPHKYIVSKRVESARRLLESTNLSAQRVAVETGFCSQAHLSTTFSKVMGMTPSQYRGRLTPDFHRTADSKP